MNADGTGEARLTVNGQADVEPSWSPDGTKIAFSSSRPNGAREIWTMNADGTAPEKVTVDPPGPGADNSNPDWQAVLPGYVRPLAATPLQASLVPAYKKCTLPNSNHGPPLAHPSCNPPVPASSYLTVGTSDANGIEADSVGSVRYAVIVGDPATPANEADLKIAVSLSHVLNRSGLTPYTGQLSTDSVLRLTDKLNSSSSSHEVPGTMQDVSFPVTVPCTPSSCAVSTTANSIAPGAIIERKRAIWQLEKVNVYDGGVDGLAGTTGDNTLFETQGVFIP